MIFLGLLFIGVGLLCILNPKAMIKFRHLGEFKNNPEPTDFAITSTIFTGILSVILGIVFIVLFFTL